jgi:putative phosphoribosyl transferase
MYYRSRAEAGEKLAQLLARYQAEKCSILALNDGGVIIGSRIAAILKCPIMLLAVEDIMIPGEFDPLASINQEGGFTYNSKYAEPEIDELEGEYHQYIEEEKIEKVHNLNMDNDLHGLVRRDLLRDRIVILVSDGINGTYELDAAAFFLKPVRTKKLIIATPLADIYAVDRMHLLGDDVYVLDTVANFMEINHYYDNNNMPEHSMILKTVRNIVSASK